MKRALYLLLILSVVIVFQNFASSQIGAPESDTSNPSVGGSSTGTTGIGGTTGTMGTTETMMGTMDTMQKGYPQIGGSMTTRSATSYGAMRYGTTMQGTMDVYQMLTMDHNTVKALLTQMQNIKSGNNSKKIAASMYVAVNNALRFHTSFEEKYLYPQLNDVNETRDIIRSSYNDHNNIKSALTQLEDINSQSDKWISMVKDLEKAVISHTNIEENQLFPMARRALGEQKTRELTERFMKEKAEMRSKVRL